MEYSGFTVYAVTVYWMVGPVDDAVKGIWMEMHVVRGVRPPFTWRERRKPEEACRDGL